MAADPSPAFDSATPAADWLETPGEALDHWTFGVIGFDASGRVVRYNVTESRASGLSVQRVMGRHVFEQVAPCMNNSLVAQRFDQALAAGAALDVTLDYVLTLRMKPTPVRLRLLARPGVATRQVWIDRRQAGAAKSGVAP